MVKRQNGTAVVVAGLALIMVSLLADSIGVGQTAGFGLRQTVGVILGFIILAVGIRLRTRKPAVSMTQPSSAEEEDQVSRMQDEGGPA